MLRFLIITAAASTLLAACASIVSRRAYPVFVDSNPTEARLTVTNEMGDTVYAGRTPKTLKLDAYDGYFSRARYVITFEHPDFETSVVRLEAKLDGWYFGNFLFGYLIGFLIVDPLTGAMYKIDERQVYEKLYFKTESNLNIMPFDSMPPDLRVRLVEVNPASR
jgi:hypothetical protein